ncbi:MAG: lycopene cyclase domain-containing protein [Ginsengibacter sp.]
MKLLYLLVDFFTIIIPLLFSFHPKIKFYKTGKPFFLAALLVAIIFIIWDIVFTSLRVWSFNNDYVTGIYFLNLPLEEILFFFCIPYSCVFTYYCLNKFYSLEWRPKTANTFCNFFSLCLLITGLIFWNKLYTSVTFISTAGICFFLKFFGKIDWFVKTVSVYTILLIPFFFVNGVLTGTGLEAPVVEYNSSETLNIRLLTIPVEDFIYGFEMVLLNIFFYQIFVKKFSLDKN